MHINKINQSLCSIPFNDDEIKEKLSFKTSIKLMGSSISTESAMCEIRFCVDLTDLFMPYWRNAKGIKQVKLCQK